VDNPIYAPLPITVSSITVSSLVANKIIANSTITGFIEGNYGEISNWYVDNTLYVNFQALTADSDQLFLNGVPVATTANLSSIQDWSLYAQVSTLDGNKQSTIGLSYLEVSTIGTRSLVSSNIFTQNLMAYNIVNFTSTVVEVYESTIQSDVKLANISTANIRNLNVSTATFSTLNSINSAFTNLSAATANINSLTGGTASFSNFTASSITVSSIVSPPVTSGSFSSLTVVSNTNTGSLTVGSNDVTTFAGATTFNAGATFNTNQGTFNAGIGTTSLNTAGLNVTGLSVFNNQTICNLANISNSNTTLNLIVDASTNTGTYPTINLQSKFGGGGVINITADQPSIFVGVPTQQVNVRAKGGVGYVTGIPVGGAINLQADAGTSNQITPTGVLANGAIRLTANSFIAGAYTVPGLILESAGSIAAYSGLTAPSLGVFGCSFYSALTTLSLTCGVSPATTSFPGVVYLRGDNGTKVVNGFYTDSINNNVLYDLNITSKTALDISNRNINIDSASNINVNTSNGGQVYINGTPITAGGTWVSTATTRLNMNGFPITDTVGALNLSSSQVYIDSTGVAPYAVITAGDPFSSLQNGQIVLQTKNNSAYSKVIDQTGVGYIQTQARSTQNFVSSSWFSGDITVSSINGQAVGGGGGGGGWVSTATTQLNMNGFTITDLTSTLRLQASSIGLQNPGGSLFGMEGGLTFISSICNAIIGTGFNASLVYDDLLSTSTTLYQTPDTIQFTQLGASGYKQEYIQGNRLSEVFGNDTYIITNSTIKTCPQNYFSGNVEVSSFSRRLIGNAIQQPILQYGVVSSIGGGASGTISVQMPQRYTTQQSFVPFACMADAPAAEIFVSTTTRATFVIGWQNGGSGDQYFNWMTMGT
jgi:hypothetical protein